MDWSSCYLNPTRPRYARPVSSTDIVKCGGKRLAVALLRPCTGCGAEPGAFCVSVATRGRWIGKPMSSSIHSAREPDGPPQSSSGPVGIRLSQAEVDVQHRRDTRAERIAAYDPDDGSGGNGRFDVEAEAAWSRRLRSLSFLRGRATDAARYRTLSIGVPTDDLRNVLDLVDQLMRSAAFSRPAEPGEVRFRERGAGAHEGDQDLAS